MKASPFCLCKRLFFSSYVSCSERHDITAINYGVEERVSESSSLRASSNVMNASSSIMCLRR
eukprot:m.12713 g.12713  ORF g.12713 m.12713 type:complete len:62 (+) comp7004_c0_seq1:119-304(+)